MDTTMMRQQPDQEQQLLPVRGGWARSEALARELERHLKTARAALHALPTPVASETPTPEWPERLLSAALPLIGVAALPLWLGVEGRTGASILAGAVCCCGVLLLGERARRMALGETLPVSADAVLPGPAWWLGLSALAAAAGAMVGGLPLQTLGESGAAETPRLLAVVAALLVTLLPAWWSADRWRRHASARLLGARLHSETAQLEAKIVGFESELAELQERALTGAKARLWAVAEVVAAPARSDAPFSDVEA